MAKVPQEFCEFQKYLNTGNALEAKNPAVAALMKISFYQAMQDIADETPISDQARQYLQSFRCPPMPPNGVEEAQAFADKLFNTLNEQFQSGNIRVSMVGQFTMCACIYSILDGEENEQKNILCKSVSVKLRKMLDKGLKKDGSGGGESGGNPPSFTPQTGNGPPPVFTPQTGNGPPPVFNPGQSSGGPPVYNPGQSSGGPPVYNPGQSSGGPPVYNPGQSSGGPPVYNPGQSSGGPPVYSPNGNAGGPPVYSPNSGGSAPTQPTTTKPKIDPNFDTKAAQKLLKSLGYNVVDTSKYPKLDETCCQAIESYLDYALSKAKTGSDKAGCLNSLKDALNIWSSGKPF